MPANPADAAGPDRTSKAPPARKNDGIYFIFLGACVVVLLAVSVLLRPNRGTMMDFRVVYFPARCLLRGLDPYDQRNVLEMLHRAAQDAAIRSAVERDIQARYIYPPSTFVVTAPLAILPWRAASILWMACNTAGLIFAAVLIWMLCRESSSRASGILIAYMLANSEVVVNLCNPSGLAIDFAVIGCWCVLKRQNLWGGVVFLALSLAIKPQEAGLIWCCFILIGGKPRRSALWAAALVVLLALPFFLWTGHIAPHWPRELQANLHALSQAGGPADPGPRNPGSGFIDLQIVFSRIKDDPGFYNLLSYVVCAPLLLAWAAVALRGQKTSASRWLGIAAIAPLSMLPVYHHFYDSKLLLLAMPGFSLLWATRRRAGWLALVLTAATLLVTGDVSRALLDRALTHLGSALGAWAEPLAACISISAAPAAMLAMGLFYLWAFWRVSFSRDDLPMHLPA